MEIFNQKIGDVHIITVYNEGGLPVGYLGIDEVAGEEKFEYDLGDIYAFAGMQNITNDKVRLATYRELHGGVKDRVVKLRDLSLSSTEMKNVRDGEVVALEALLVNLEGKIMRLEDK